MKPNYLDMVVSVIFKELLGRKGFDEWWDEIGQENRNEIVDNLQILIAPIMESYKSDRSDS